MSDTTPPAATADPLVLLLWGNSQVGKTSVLAAGLQFGTFQARFPTVDWEKSHPSVQETLADNIRRLTVNTLIPSTGEAAGVRTELTFKSGRRLLIQDVKGGLSDAPALDDARRFLDAAHAVLFMVEWESRDLPRQLLPVQLHLPALGNRPVGLAFTKCERGLDHGHPAWTADPEGKAGKRWWEGNRALGPHDEEVLRQVPAVWATSVYGYNRDYLPACVLDEFGELIPYRIAPRNVGDVFAWFITRLGL